MKKIMPQEIEVWYLIPALRKELARIFVEDYGLKRNKAAEMLGITNAAISQYLSSKRGSGINFSARDKKEIKKAAEEIIKNDADVMKKIYDLCLVLRKSKTICEMHKSQDKTISGNCDVCFRN